MGIRADGDSDCDRADGVDERFGSVVKVVVVDEDVNNVILEDVSDTVVEERVVLGTRVNSLGEVGA